MGPSFNFSLPLPTIGNLEPKKTPGTFYFHKHNIIEGINMMDRRVCSMVALLLLWSCTSIPSIPDTVLEQDRQRIPLLGQCSIFIRTFARATDPTKVNLNPCREHQRLAEKIAVYFESFPKEREVTPVEYEVYKRVMDDYVSVGIELCYAKVRLGEKINDSQGRSGTAVCDRLVDEKRHQQTLEAIERAKFDAMLTEWRLRRLEY
jgi:hypothetical protein